MFDYKDPIGRGILANQGALAIYRDVLEVSYKGTTLPANAFEKLERFPAASPTVDIEWPAFPITANGSDTEIDDVRFVFQDEYVEWRVEKDANDEISLITFTTEFPEYYESLAEVSEDALIAGIQDAIPGSNPTTEELFGTGFDPATATATERAEAFRAQSVIPFVFPAPENVPNPWNNNQKGILCLGQQFNTLGALFNLAEKCSRPNPGIPVTGQCAAVGGACGENRNSDPRICARAQEVARIPRALSLHDPAGVVLLKLEGTWKIGSNVIDINDEAANSGVWKVSRNGRRATFRPVANLTVNDGPVATGAQLSRFLTVAATVISAEPGDLIPAIAAAAPSTRQLPSLTRGI